MNKFRHHLLIILTLSLTNLFGQTGEKQVSFLEKIDNVVKDTSSQYFYPKLLNKVKKSGDSITKDDMFYLYYGQLGQAGPKRLFFVDPEMTEFLKFSLRGKCKKAIPIGLKILERNPAELTILWRMKICIEKTQQTDKYFLNTRFRLLLDAILSTGNGLTKETAVKITNNEDDLVLKGIMGLLGGEESILDTEDNKSYSVWRKGNDTLYFEDLWIN
ncbi:DUF4919 domain-containing protein [Flavobacterium sp. CYK-4]|uniref:DUF4919 domain-containing protein n=1 Tax=Flavobacterium lotistagni TaxID=2709660 RepID=UPI00140D13B4|nr:DUF4919 domain-containing protein [Flavobacterium lotistagni]NHM07505.1 DUF4919 domain-containing protein [Flavobacterium lotistagni]